MHTPEDRIDPGLKPTRDTYDAFQHAYDHFNWMLFEAELPNCLITLQRKGRTYGYFHRKRFAREDGKICDEIALNPAHFRSRSAEEVLSTLVHEMTHLWQFHFGTPGRGRYHNRQWAEKMKSLGLHPSDTGSPGGRELGDRVSHYIMDGGSFARAADELIESGFVIEWREPLARPAKIHPSGASGAGGSAAPIHPSRSSKEGKRIKYSCPACGLNAWAKHDALLVCGADRINMEAQ